MSEEEYREPSEEAVDFARSLAALMESIAERNRARGECDHSWGHFGWSYEEAVKQRTVEMEDAMAALVRRSLGGGK